jgi:hypothetical protein
MAEHTNLQLISDGDEVAPRGHRGGDTRPQCRAHILCRDHLKRGLTRRVWRLLPHASATSAPRLAISS